jgi:hypothetical protein
MRQRILFFAFVLIAVLAGTLIFFDGAKREKLAGRPVTYWLDEMNEGGARSNNAVSVFLQAGSAAVPALTNELRFVPPNRERVIQLKAKLPWRLASRLPKGPRINYLRRCAAAFALGELGPREERNSRIARNRDHGRHRRVDDARQQRRHVSR